jgi:hypothetical protein
VGRRVSSCLLKESVVRRSGTGAAVAVCIAVVCGVFAGPALAAGPVNIAVPTISPPTAQTTVQTDQLLTLAPGKWMTPPTTVTDHWERCNNLGTPSSCVPIGATFNGYTVTPADVGSTIEVLESATDGTGTTTAFSAPTAVVTAAPPPPAPVNTVLPNVSGAAQQGATLAAVGDTWTNNPNLVTFQWERCDVAGNNCTLFGTPSISSVYTLVPADAGHTMRVVEIASNAGGSSPQATSHQTAVVIGPPVNNLPPGFSGTPQLGQTLTEVPGVWTFSPSVAIQWLRCDSSGNACATVGGANGSTYTLGTADLGNTIRVQEFASNADDTGGPVTSPASAVVVPPPPAGGARGPANSAATSVVGSIPTSTSLTAAPTALVTNQGVTLIATVTSSSSSVRPSGTITFENHGSPIRGCTNETVSPIDQSVTLTCGTSFAASTSPEQLVAVFEPSPGSNLGSSTNPQPMNLTIRQDSTSTDLQVSSTTANLRSSVTYTATVTPSHTGSSQPSGSVTFLDGGKPIALCRSQRLIRAGAFLNATCKLTYGRVGSHHITATYGGDGNAARSSSSPTTVNIRRPNPHCCLMPLMQWTFYHTPSYTAVLTLLVNKAPVGSSVTVVCHGRGCGFAKQAVAIKKATPCKTTSKHKCAPQHPGTMDFASRFRGRHLVPGAQITVAITEAGWIGKYYSFTTRSGRAPQVKINCLAPGSTRPGVGC